MKSFLQRWLITTLAVLVAVYVVPGIDYDKPLDLLVASLLLGILNAFLRPLLLLLSLPLLFLTLGLFTLVINAVLLYLVGLMLDPNFRVEGFWAAFWGALIISLVSMTVNLLAGGGKARIIFHRGKTSSRDHHDDGGQGPVIDV